MRPLLIFGMRLFAYVAGLYIGNSNVLLALDIVRMRPIVELRNTAIALDSTGENPATGNPAHSDVFAIACHRC